MRLDIKIWPKKIDVAVNVESSSCTLPAFLPYLLNSTTTRIYGLFHSIMQKKLVPDNHILQNKNITTALITDLHAWLNLRLVVPCGAWVTHTPHISIQFCLVLPPPLPSSQLYLKRTVYLSLSKSLLLGIFWSISSAVAFRSAYFRRRYHFFSINICPRQFRLLLLSQSSMRLQSVHHYIQILIMTEVL